MNFQKAFENLFSFDTSMEAIIFTIILLITFVLGGLLWALLAHFPQRRKLKNQLITLSTQLKTLDKEYEELEERHSVQSAKVKRLEEAATKDELTIGNQEKRIVQLEKLYLGIEKERDKQFKEAEDAKQQLDELKKLYKFAQVEILEANDKEFSATQAKEKALKRVEEMKGLIEEMEQDRQKAAEKLQASYDELDQIKNLLAEESTAVEELKKDLGRAIERLSAYEDKTTEDLLNEQEELRHAVAGLKDYSAHLEQQQAQLQTQYQTLQSEYEQLDTEKSSLQEEKEQLEHQNENLLARKDHLEEEKDKLLQEKDQLIQKQQSSTAEETEAFKTHPSEEVDDSAKEAPEKTAHAEVELSESTTTEQELVWDEELLDQRLNETEKVMNKRGLFADIDENDVIENLAQLEESLAQLQPETQPRGLESEENERIDLDESENSSMEQALEKAAQAMNYQGFFKELEEGVILEQADDGLDEESRMERALEHSALWIEKGSSLEQFDEEELIEDQSLLDAQLRKEPEVQGRGLIEDEDEAEELTIEEEQQLNRALKKAEFALQEEGLYSEINPDQFLGTEEIFRDQIVEQSTEQEKPKAERKDSDVNIYQHIPPAEVVDNLKKINGIGASLEEKLNKLGISSFKQLTALDDEEIIHQLEALLEIPHNSIYQDQWITQAKQLSTKQKISNLTRDMNLNKLFKR